MPVPIVTFISTDEYVDDNDDEEEEEEYDNLQDLKGKDALNGKELISFQTPMVDCLY